MAPDLIQQLIAGKQPSAVANKGAKQLELERADFQRTSRAAQFAARKIHLDVSQKRRPERRRVRRTAAEGRVFAPAAHAG